MRHITARLSTQMVVEPGKRIPHKQALIKIGYPVEDLAGYVEGERLPIELRSVTRQSLTAAVTSGKRRYYAAVLCTAAAVASFCLAAGKTIVGMAIMGEPERLRYSHPIPSL